ncbi:MAG TPA: hypothetical protein DCX06_07170 [Opitutae bacterium]|mgnify:CR=1 FL=1|nr:hypothetical protein [Opitutae bacterium]
MMIKSTLHLLILIPCFGLSLWAESPRIYELWQPDQAPNGGPDLNRKVMGGGPFDKDWERWSYPIGNGYMGANIFGRVDSERIQITEKTLHNNKGLTNFAELYLDFNHGDVSNYRRSLNLNEAIAYVSYEKDGVTFTREYFMSYPDNVMVVKVSADRRGALSFGVRPEIPYLNLKDKRSGTVTAQADLLTLAGTLPHFNINFEGQVKVLNEGGSLKTETVGGNSVITVSDADSVTLLVAAGTNYHLGNKVFTSKHDQKLDPKEFPHEAVTARIASAHAKGFDVVKQSHLQDYQNLFGRVSVNLNSEVSPDPTHTLLTKYKRGEKNTYLEELMFQYARYLLIASSRQNTLPSNLQGAWSQYQYTPWTGGFWHNINVQMNYWGSLSTNLSECFEAYIGYFKAYYPKAKEYASDYVKEHNPDRLGKGDEDNGWIIGTAANAYDISPAGGGHSGPGTGGFTSKLLMEYYLFTQDREYLEDVAYPAMRSMSQFFSKALVPHGDLLLVEPSASPEQQIPDEKQLIGMPGHIGRNRYYVTVGCTFDQGFVWENHHDTLILAKELGKDDDFLRTIEDQMSKLDPIQIGTSGQIKEYREEEAYSDIGQRNHRHISHLCPLFPGSLINAENPAWMQAASKTLDLRGNRTTGWAMAHRMNCRARLKEGEKAYEVYQKFISERTVSNLWTLHPPFQIDGSLGTMAGVAEMLLQSHAGYVETIPALPAAWANGSFEGLVARGNFVVSALWEDGKTQAIKIESRSGEPLILQTDMDRFEFAGSTKPSFKAVDGSEGRKRWAIDLKKGETITLVSAAR